MPDHDPIETLRRYSKENSANLKQRVRDTVTELSNTRQTVNISAVARHAGVSREFIHSHPDLLQLIRAAAKKARDERPIPALVDQHVAAGLKADRAVLMTKIDKQKTTIDQQAKRIGELEHQRQLWLGSQMGEDLIDPEEHAELRITNDRLMAEVAALNAKVAELRRLNRILESDLAASRQAHMEDVATMTTPTGTVSPIGRRKA